MSHIYIYKILSIVQKLMAINTIISKILPKHITKYNIVIYTYIYNFYSTNLY